MYRIRPFAASHLRGTKLPCWRAKVALGQDKQIKLPLACEAGAKRGGRGEGTKHERGEREGSPSPLSPTPGFDISARPLAQASVKKCRASATHRSLARLASAIFHRQEID